jgi:hypothetical protein
MRAISHLIALSGIPTVSDQFGRVAQWHGM